MCTVVVGNIYHTITCFNQRPFWKDHSLTFQIPKRIKETEIFYYHFKGPWTFLQNSILKSAKFSFLSDLTAIPHLGHGPALTDEVVHVLREGAVLDTFPEHGDRKLDQRLRRQGPGCPVIVSVPHPDQENLSEVAIEGKIPFYSHLRSVPRASPVWVRLGQR